MADSAVQRESEKWVRDHWLPERYGQRFTKRRLDLRSGGQFEFDGVSEDRRIAVAISTSGGLSSSGRKASPKLNKIRSDTLFLILAEAERRIVVFTDRAMCELCSAERENGRFPLEIELVLADLPEELEARLKEARARSAAEVTPRFIE
jgi:hypothetical protein